MSKELKNELPIFNTPKYLAIKSAISEIIKFSFIIYALGFFVVNSSLLEYGFINYEMTSARYLLAGILFIVICALVLLTIEVCRKQKTTHSKVFIYGMALYVEIMALCFLLGFNIFKKNIIYEPAWLFIVLFAAVSILPIFSFYLSSKFTGKFKNVIEVAILSIPIIFLILYGSKENIYLGLFVILVAGEGNALLNKKGRINSNYKLEDFDTPKYLVNRIISLVFIPILFGTQIYPNVERMRGGGKPLEAKIIMQTGYAESFKDIKNEFRIDFDNVKIIFETGESLYLGAENTIGKKIAIEISKRNLIAVVYKKSNILLSPVAVKEKSKH